MSEDNNQKCPEQEILDAMAAEINVAINAAYEDALVNGIGFIVVDRELSYKRLTVDEVYNLASNIKKSFNPRRD